jgi:hypothetical protein
LLFRERLVDDRRTAIAAARARNGVERDAHVGAVAARVDDYRPFDPEPGMQFL